MCIARDSPFPTGVHVLKASPADPRIETLGFGEEAVLRWKVQADRPMSRASRPCPLDRAAPGSPSEVHGQAKLSFTPRLSLARTGYVPEPKPVRGPYEVGVYYFPGWTTASQWEPIRRFPERRPVLGWYREGSPELADWQIKWAVEHGITFFAYDWYWSQGSRQLEHGPSRRLLQGPLPSPAEVLPALGQSQRAGDVVARRLPGRHAVLDRATTSAGPST